MQLHTIMNCSFKVAGNGNIEVESDANSHHARVILTPCLDEYQQGQPPSNGISIGSLLLSSCLVASQLWGQVSLIEHGTRDIHEGRRQESCQMLPDARP